MLHPPRTVSSPWDTGAGPGAVFGMGLTGSDEGSAIGGGTSGGSHSAWMPEAPTHSVSNAPTAVVDSVAPLTGLPESLSARLDDHVGRLKLAFMEVCCGHTTQCTSCCCVCVCVLLAQMAGHAPRATPLDAFCVLTDPS